MQKSPFTARDAAVDALAIQVAGRPMTRVELRLDELSRRDRPLATAIHRTTLQHWLTLAYLLDRCLRRPVGRLEPMLAAVLAAGAAQIVFMEKIPASAAVDQAVGQARRRLRKGAGQLANAVLRKIAELVEPVTAGQPWQPSRDALPVPGGLIRLKRPVLPDPAEAVAYWSVVSSHPQALVATWFEQFGPERAGQLLLHSMKTPPIILQTPGGAWVWSGEHEALVEHLAEHPDQRVQDPTSARPVAATAGLAPKRIIDYCAGRGTKTRQLSAMYPTARIVATEANPVRLELLGQLNLSNVEVLPIGPVEAMAGQADLLVLDVPCSNTGVLARRPEARYRYSRKTLGKLVDLQRSIINRALPLVSRGGAVLYATCSIEQVENQPQARRIADKLGGTVVREEQTLPGGEGETYHDGGYWALIGR